MIIVGEGRQLRKPPEFDDRDVALCEVIAPFARWLANWGWSVSLLGARQPAAGRRFVLRHPIALDFDLVVFADSTEEDLRGLIRAAAEWRDVQLSMKLPEPVLHPVLMRYLRVACASHQWTRTTLTQVAECLVAAGSLTQSEAGWVADAGPLLLAEGQFWEP